MKFSDLETMFMNNSPFIFMMLIIFGIVGAIVIGITFMADSLGTNERYEQNQIDEQRIIDVIKSNQVTCDYITDLRVEYSGDGFVNALDDSWIKSKLRAFWNTHSCGVKWEWWD